MAKQKACPECGHEFRHGWDGIDSHWIMRYEEAWPLIQCSKYKRHDKHKREDVEQAARIVRNATEQ